MKQLAPMLLVLAAGVQFPEPMPAPDGALVSCITESTRNLITDAAIDTAVLQCAARVNFTGDIEGYRP